MYKGHEGTNVKTCNEFCNNLMKMCFNHKTKMKVDDKIKIIGIVF
jgi:hypothetical protein